MVFFLLLLDLKIELCSVFMSHFHHGPGACIFDALLIIAYEARELIVRPYQDNDMLVCACVCVCVRLDIVKYVEKLVNFPRDMILWPFFFLFGLPFSSLALSMDS